MSLFSTPRPRPAASAGFVPPLALLALVFWGAAPPVCRGAGPAPLAIVERSIAQDQGGWQVDYRLRHTAASGLIVTPGEIFAKVEGWVSNSRVPSHALPR